MSKKESWLPEGRIVSICEFNDTIYVATTKGVYMLYQDKFHRVKFVEPERNE